MSVDKNEPAPKRGDKVIIHLVMQDFMRRADMGYDKHGTYLMSNNGRDALWDAYQEAIDLCMYLRQLIVEREGKENV